MIKATKTLELRTFQELSPDEKSKLINAIRTREVEDNIWADWIESDFQHELEADGWRVKGNIGWYASRGAIAFSGFINIEEFCENHIKDWLPKHNGCKETFKEIRSVMDDIDISSTQSRDGWSCQLEIDTDSVSELDFASKEQYNRYVEQLEMIQDEIESAYDDIIKKYGKILEEQYEYLQSDEYLTEYLNDLDRYYDENLEFYDRDEMERMEVKQ